ncbi:MAG: PadR family transcriptional regulator [Anaerolineae bacterium]|jgi:DNA-binding PadR family transcriptional regulator
MERELLLLGLLRSQDMHGYQLHEAIDSHLGMGVQLTKPTAYRLLSNMAEDGWVTFREEQEGNRPPRRVYAITPQGEVAFQRLLRENLANYQPSDFTCHIGLAFLDELSAEEGLHLLHKRRTDMEELLESTQTHGEHPGSLQLMLERQVHLLAAELEWLDTVIAQLQNAQDETGVQGGSEA